MFTAHFSSTGIDVLKEMDFKELFEWHEKAINVHNYLNTPSKTNE